MRAAWALRMAPEARAAAAALLAPTWAADRDKELVRDQAEARFVIGETLVAQMKSDAAKVAAALEKPAASVGRRGASLRPTRRRWRRSAPRSAPRLWASLRRGWRWASR